MLSPNEIDQQKNIISKNIFLPILPFLDKKEILVLRNVSKDLYSLTYLMSFVIVRIWLPVYGRDMVGHVSIQTCLAGREDCPIYMSFWPSTSTKYESVKGKFNQLREDRRDEDREPEYIFYLCDLDCQKICKAFFEFKFSDCNWWLLGSSIVKYLIKHKNNQNCVGLSLFLLNIGGFNKLNYLKSIFQYIVSIVLNVFSTTSFMISIYSILLDDLNSKNLEKIELLAPSLYLNFINIFFVKKYNMSHLIKINIITALSSLSGSFLGGSFALILYKFQNFAIGLGNMVTGIHKFLNYILNKSAESSLEYKPFIGSDEINSGIKTAIMSFGIIGGIIPILLKVNFYLINRSLLSPKDVRDFCFDAVEYEKNINENILNIKNITEKEGLFVVRYRKSGLNKKMKLNDGYLLDTIYRGTVGNKWFLPSCIFVSVSTIGFFSYKTGVINSIIEAAKFSGGLFNRNASQ